MAIYRIKRFSNNSDNDMSSIDKEIYRIRRKYIPRRGKLKKKTLEAARIDYINTPEIKRETTIADTISKNQ